MGIITKYDIVPNILILPGLITAGVTADCHVTHCSNMQVITLCSTHMWHLNIIQTNFTVECCWLCNAEVVVGDVVVSRAVELIGCHRGDRDSWDMGF